MTDGTTLQTRRCMLRNSAVGFGWLALRGLLDQEAAANELPSALRGPLAAKVSHFAARAQRVVFLFMKGGPSHVDTFDPKPLLTRDDGKPPPFELPRITFAKSGNLLKSPWKFHRYGESGLPVSDWRSSRYLRVCGARTCASRAAWSRHVSTTVKWLPRMVCCRTSKRRFPVSWRLSAASLASIGATAGLGATSTCDTTETALVPAAARAGATATVLYGR